MDGRIIISTLPIYWGKTELQIGIHRTNSTSLLTAEQYENIVKEGIMDWQNILQRFANQRDEHRHLNKIKFTVSTQLSPADDIQIQLPYCNPKNGLTIPDPAVGMVQKVQVLVWKANGPQIDNMSEITPNHGPQKLRTNKEIKSIVMHELGHVLGLGHCTYYKDLMFTGENQPDPNRQISLLDLEVLSELFRRNGPTEENWNVVRSIPISSWIPL